MGDKILIRYGKLSGEIRDTAHQNTIVLTGFEPMAHPAGLTTFRKQFSPRTEAVCLLLVLQLRLEVPSSSDLKGFSVTALLSCLSNY